MMVRYIERSNDAIMIIYMFESPGGHSEDISIPRFSFSEAKNGGRMWRCKANTMQQAHSACHPTNTSPSSKAVHRTPSMIEFTGPLTPFIIPCEFKTVQYSRVLFIPMLALGLPHGRGFSSLKWAAICSKPQSSGRQGEG